MKYRRVMVVSHCVLIKSAKSMREKYNEFT